MYMMDGQQTEANAVGRIILIRIVGNSVAVDKTILVSE